MKPIFGTNWTRGFRAQKTTAPKRVAFTQEAVFGGTPQHEANIPPRTGTLDISPATDTDR